MYVCKCPELGQICEDFYGQSSEVEFKWYNESVCGPIMIWKMFFPNYNFELSQDWHFAWVVWVVVEFA
jgi:hypothetical protein